MNFFFLYPGKIEAFKDETIISTLLGSCVAVAIFDPAKKIGGLSHFLLPSCAPYEIGNPRYGAFAIPALIKECVKLGADSSRLQAKVYGGANVISMASLGQSVGSRNIEIAESILNELRIPIIERDVGGESARTIKMNTSTFDVQLKSSQTSHPNEPVEVSGFKSLMEAQNIKVLVVDDSATVRTLFSNIFAKSGLEVVGAAADAYQAREMIVKKNPDVITLDIEMPKMSGVSFLEKIMTHHPIPVVMVSSLSNTGEAALRSLELGAIEFVHKPSQFDPAVLRDLAGILVNKVKAAATVNVLKKIKEQTGNIRQEVQSNIPSTIAKTRKGSQLNVVVVGGNAGSNEALEKFISGLAIDSPPVVVACSTIANFVSAYIGKLKAKSKVTSVVGKDGDLMQMGYVYFVPAQHQGEVCASPQGPYLRIKKGPPVTNQLPSSDVLFRSAADAYSKGVFALLLGGFGTDGVNGLMEIQSKGGTTIVQNPNEALFPFGPQKAIELGVADEVLPSESISNYLMEYRNKNVY